MLAVIGILDELTQPLVNRYASVGDYAADLIGILLACPILLVKRRFRVRYCRFVDRACASRE